MIPRVRIHKTNHDKNHHIPNSESVWFQSLGRGLVGGKRRRRKTGTLLETSWNLAGTSLPSWNSAATLLEVCWNLLEPSCWNCAGTFLEPLWNLLEPCWNCVRTVLELSWNLLGTFLELCWNLTGTMLEFLRFCFGDGAYSCGFEPEDKFRVLLFVFFRLCCLLRFVTFF